MGKLNHKFGLRAVAVVEALKGVAVIALCFVLLSLLHKDLDTVVDHLTEWLRLNPDSRVADWFYDLADRTTGRGIWTAVSVGLAWLERGLANAFFTGVDRRRRGTDPALVRPRRWETYPKLSGS